MSVLLAIAFGALFLIVGRLVWQSADRDAALRDRMLGTTWSAIGRAPRQGWIKIRGKAAGEPTVRAPFSGREALFYSAKVEEWRADGEGGGNWHAIAREQHAKAFLLDDDTGKARIEPHRARFLIDTVCYGECGLFNDARPWMDAFLERHRRKSTSILGINRRLRFNEELIAPGDTVLAYGPATEGAEGEVVLGAGSGEKDLVVSTREEIQVFPMLIGRKVAGGVLMATGALVVLAAVLLGI